MSEQISAKLTWEDVRPVATEAFRVWVDQPELAWAESAWLILGNEGLTSYRNDRERTEVALRFVALVGLYRDWCYQAMDEECRLAEWEILDWFARAGGRMDLLGATEDNDDDDPPDREAIVVDALAGPRSEVVNALKSVYGGTNGLFVALWRSTEVPSPETDAVSLSELEYDILNEVTDLKLRGFSWIEDDCPL